MTIPVLLDMFIVSTTDALKLSAVHGDTSTLILVLVNAIALLKMQEQTVLMVLFFSV